MAANLAQVLPTLICDIKHPMDSQASNKNSADDFGGVARGAVPRASAPSSHIEDSV